MLHIKSVALAITEAMAYGWRLIPNSLRRLMIVGLVLVESRDSNPANSLRRLLALRDRIDWIINERVMTYNKGEHPKHRLTGYHDFFIKRIKNGQNVLDVGCGYGAVARSIALAYPRCQVTGLDLDKPRLAQARASNNNPKNLNFIEADATKAIHLDACDVVILSNVLEHIIERVHFLRKLQSSFQCQHYLIRVPLFERDWQMALRRELGVDYRSDEDHKIEYTLSEFRAEIAEAGLRLIEVQTMWGEIWADCMAISHIACR